MARKPVKVTVCLVAHAGFGEEAAGLCAFFLLYCGKLGHSLCPSLPQAAASQKAVVGALRNASLVRS